MNKIELDRLEGELRDAKAQLAKNALNDKFGFKSEGKDEENEKES